MTAYIGIFKGETREHFRESEVRDPPEEEKEEDALLLDKVRNAILVDKVSGFITSSARTIGPIDIEFRSEMLPDEPTVVAYSVVNNSKGTTLRVAAPEVAILSEEFAGLAWEPVSMIFGPERSQVLKPFDRLEMKVDIGAAALGEAKASIFLDGEEVARFLTTIHARRGSS